MMGPGMHSFNLGNPSSMDQLSSSSFAFGTNMYNAYARNFEDELK